MRFRNFFFSKIELKPLAVFRIILGAIFLVYTLVSFPHWTEDYGSQGMMANAAGEFYQTYSFSLLDITHGFIGIEAWWFVQLFFGVCFLAGAGGRLTALILFWIVTSVLYRNLMSSNSEQTVFRYAFFFTILLPISREMSIDQWLREKLKSKDGTGLLALWRRGLPVPQTWALRSMQFHVALVYPISTLWKLFSDPEWINGEALYWIIINESWSRFPWPSLFLYGFVTKSATWGSLLLEGSFGFVVWFEKFRKLSTLAMIVFHILIGAFLANLTFFSLSTAACLTLFFKEEDYPWFKKHFRR